jgi:hypothetical protein
MRFLISLQDYNFDIIYRPGHKNEHSDALSRIPLDIFDKKNDVIDEKFLIKQNDILIYKLKVNNLNYNAIHLNPLQPMNQTEDTDILKTNIWNN